MRKRIPDRVKIAVILRQDGICSLTGEPFTPEMALAGKIEFDHDPPISQREIDPVSQETIPSQNDPAYIFAISKDAHKTLTFKKRGLHRGDISQLKHIDRARRKHAAHKRRMEDKGID